MTDNPELERLEQAVEESLVTENATLKQRVAELEAERDALREALTGLESAIAEWFAPDLAETIGGSLLERLKGRLDLARQRARAALNSPHPNQNERERKQSGQGDD